MTTTTKPEARTDHDLKCEQYMSSSGTYVRYCRRPASFAIQRGYGSDAFIAICKMHASHITRRQYSSQEVVELTDDLIASIGARVADEKARDDAERAKRRREQERLHKQRIADEWAKQDVAWTSTLSLDMGWREDEVHSIDIYIHPVDQRHDAWDSFVVEVEMDDDDSPAEVRVRNANHVSPAAANELTQAVAQAALWLLELNER